ncbi:SDR family NAD(P)-dependent oxidoreductase [Prosthecodimorpha staleyi]|uniref:SDR family oxidoreductase n=1 Tax=Prosthecodimorpha staleyi TaxID=2840188 RepID=A0A947GDK5_9HYPH|nr:SDR family NAD(P)-dependent oxidoreductase [Prosthecodimorpha staleyi]MBT9290391.1 SDR family oxidoreductase [Prosthecodimorpha staleyi]
MSAPVLLVTGAGRGIGAATARLAGARGYRVAVNYRSDAAAAAATVAAIRDAGGEAEAFAADVGEPDAIPALFDAVAAHFGPVSDLVNNAGLMGGPTRLVDLETEELERLFRTNVFGTILCCREAARRMSLSRGGVGGRIVNVSSIAAVNGSIGERVHYAASKGAVNSFTIGFSREVARDGIRVNVFSPGLTATELNPPERIARLGPTVPFGRAGDPDEMARGILWLLSPEAEYCIGANLTMSGGR